MNKTRWVLAVGMVLLSLALVIGWQRTRTTSTDALYTRQSFQKKLVGMGMNVQSPNPTHFEAVFDLGPDGSYGFQTDQGSIDVAFFPTSVEGIVRMEEVRQYSWEVRGWEGSKPIGTNRQLFFIVHRNLVIATDNESLYRTLSRELSKCSLSS